MSDNSVSRKTSEIVRDKLIDVGGTATVHTLQGKAYSVTITRDRKSFETRMLPQGGYGFDVFDVIVDLLKENNGKARKGAGRGKYNKLGQPGCELDTVVGAVAHRYVGKNPGDSVFDPVFALAAILEWAEICYNERGFLILRG